MKKGKKVGESNIALKDEDPKKEDTKYETEFEEESEQEMQPVIPTTANFELKGHILA